MNELAISAIELFSGVGMLGEGVRAGLAHMGISYRTCVHVEREAHAAAVLVARMEEGSLDEAPIWSDVTTFDAAAWRGKVDCVVAGFPCQDLSVAGRRAGLDGKRSGLFFEVTRIADDSGAWLIVLENVAGIATATASVVDEAEGILDERATARVLGELADRGWNAEWISVSASDVGANHGRARWFCIAWRMDDAKCSEWRKACSTGTGREQGNDGRRPEAHGRAGVTEQILGDTRLQHGDVQQRAIWAKYSPAVVNVDHPNSNGAQRPGRAQQGADSRCEELADTAIIRRKERSRINGAETEMVKTPKCEQRIGHRRGTMANASGAGPQGHEQSAAHEPDGRTDGRTDARTMPINYRISS